MAVDLTPERSLKVEDFFDSGDEYDKLLAEAIDYASTEEEENFTSRMLTLWEKYGMRAYLTKHQVKKLRQVAGWEE